MLSRSSPTETKLLVAGGSVIKKGPDGTTYYGLNGQAFVESFATGQTIMLNLGNKLFVPANPSQASNESLSSSVQSFVPGSVNQWWNTKHPSPIGPVVGGVVVVVMVAVVGVLVPRRAMGRRLPPPASADVKRLGDKLEPRVRHNIIITASRP